MLICVVSGTLSDKQVWRYTTERQRLCGIVEKCPGKRNRILDFCKNLSVSRVKSLGDDADVRATAPAPPLRP